MMRSAKGSSISVVSPGTILDSWTAVGIPIFAAAFTTGKLAYPPVPTTTSGRNSFKMARASRGERTRLHIDTRLCLSSLGFKER